MFSKSADNFNKLQQNRSVIQNNIAQKSDEKNLNIYNRLRLDAAASASSTRELPMDIRNTKLEESSSQEITGVSGSEIISRIHLNNLDRNNSIHNENSSEEEEEEESAFIQKNEKLQNLISSLSEIPESCYAEDEKEETKSERSLLFYENQRGLERISGLSEIKNTLLNIFIYPAIFPHLFPRKIRWNQILLYGPPGTGKSMLASAIAAEIDATLHRISSADLLSHWQGETEKQIRSLFAEVRLNPEPTVLFFDEIDGLCRKRTQTEDDNVRRIKTELLTQLDDFMSVSEAHQMYIIGATNCPWEIDSGFMRRFHRRIFVPLPDNWGVHHSAVNTEIDPGVADFVGCSFTKIIKF